MLGVVNVVLGVVAVLAAVVVVVVDFVHVELLLVGSMNLGSPAEKMTAARVACEGALNTSAGWYQSGRPPRQAVSIGRVVATRRAWSPVWGVNTAAAAPALSHITCAHIVFEVGGRDLAQ